MRIKSVSEDQATGELAVQYAEAKADSVLKRVPPIIQTMSLRPDFMAAIRQAVNTLHFKDGALSRAQHEMVASYVSALNRCRY
jgi:hypothetical protein